MRKLPLGIQTFEEIRADDYLYVDKTAIAQELIANQKYVFLSRPRRFGKSLFLSTLQALFEGKKAWFTGLAAEKTHDWETTHPVIRIGFSGNFDSVARIDNVIATILRDNQTRLGLADCDSTTPSVFFSNLIHRAYEKYQQKVVVLIDEYDKPILDNIDKPELAESARSTLQGFYVTMKENDAYLRFAFLTGVSKFSKVSIFSGLNNLTDISLMPKYATICGYTQQDIDTQFSEHLAGVDKTQLRDWYNGYQFNGEPVYNPYGMLRFIDNNQTFKNYWFETATPTFLTKLMRRRQYYLPELERTVLSENALSAIGFDDISVESLLLQTGYLTVAHVFQSPRGGEQYQLKIPNREVRISLSECLAREIAHHSPSAQIQHSDALYLALLDADEAGIKQTLEQIFATIPYHLYSNTPLAHYEGYYSVVIYSYLLSLGLEIELEKTTNKGRLDMVINFPDKRYLIEFKMDGKGDALSQILDNHYFQAFLDSDTPIYLLGIYFDEAQRNVSQVAMRLFDGD